VRGRWIEEDRRVSAVKSVLIVDDHAGFRTFARRLLESSGFVVAGEAEDGGRALLATQELEPDVILLDIKLPDVDGFEVARRLARSGCSSSVVLVSNREAADYREELGLSDVAGFIEKEKLTGLRLHSILAVP
jgi:DNA-binding NarL/FixJ family response regulator